MTRNILWFWHWGTVQLLTKHSHIWFFSRHIYIWYFNVSNMKVNFQFSWEKTNYCFEWAWCFKMCSAVKKSHREGGESVVIPVEGLFSLICTFFTVSNGLFPLFQHVREAVPEIGAEPPSNLGYPLRGSQHKHRRPCVQERGQWFFLMKICF